MSTVQNAEELNPKWLGVVAQQVESLRFGVVQIIVHENRVVQIEKTEKVRLDKAEAATRTEILHLPEIWRHKTNGGELTEPSEAN